MHLVETHVAQHSLQQLQAQGCRDGAGPYHPLRDLAWEREREAARSPRPAGITHPFPA